MNAFKTSVEYHDALDRREAQERNERIERELNEAETCCCYKVMGDNKDCPIHGKYFTDESETAEEYHMRLYKADYQERSDLYTMGMGG